MWSKHIENRLKFTFQTGMHNHPKDKHDCDMHYFSQTVRDL